MQCSMQDISLLRAGACQLTKYDSWQAFLQLLTHLLSVLSATNFVAAMRELLPAFIVCRSPTSTMHLPQRCLKLL